MRYFLLMTFSLFVCLSAAESVVAKPVFDGTARQAIESWRLLQYQGKTDAVTACLAPAAPGWVDSRSNSATAGNIVRIGKGVYGFAVLDCREDGDAAVAIVRAAWTDDGNKVSDTPFYMWRVKGRWTYLPNPLEVETWYQGVPSEVEPAFDRLKKWAKGEIKGLQTPDKDEAAKLLQSWTEEMKKLSGT